MTDPSVPIGDRVPVRSAGSRPVDGLLLSVGTLTALRVPAPRAVDTAACRVAMFLAPLVGILPGLAAALVAVLAHEAGHTALIAAALGVGTWNLSTRGMHLDGLSDTADGLASSYDRQRALDVMRRGNAGPAGLAMVTIVVTVQILALAAALDHLGPVAPLVACVAGRAVLPVLCARGIPAARPGGLGAAMAGCVPRTAAALAAGFAAVLAALLAGLGRVVDVGVQVPVPNAEAAVHGALAVALALVAAGLLARRAVTRLGGITGDVLGAGVELGTTAALLALSAWPS
jgi:adenosylcobinamide-GDP ribazoletransferase